MDEYTKRHSKVGRIFYPSLQKPQLNLLYKIWPKNISPGCNHLFQILCQSSGFYLPKSRVKIGLIPPFLKLPPTSTSCHQKHLGQNAVQMSKCIMRIGVRTIGKVSNKFVLHRIQRKQWNIGVKKDQYKKYNVPYFSLGAGWAHRA